jgi:hypothetical protein
MPEDLSYPLTVDTIGKLIALGIGAGGWCPTCQKIRDIDLNKVAEKVGRDWRYIGAHWPVKCRDCGTSLKVSLTRAAEAMTKKNPSCGRPRLRSGEGIKAALGLLTMILVGG